MREEEIKLTKNEFAEMMANRIMTENLSDEEIITNVREYIKAHVRHATEKGIDELCEDMMDRIKKMRV